MQYTVMICWSSYTSCGTDAWAIFVDIFKILRSNIVALDPAAQWFSCMTHFGCGLIGSCEVENLLWASPFLCINVLKKWNAVRTFLCDVQVCMFLSVSVIIKIIVHMSVVYWCSSGQVNVAFMFLNMKRIKFLFNFAQYMHRYFCKMIKLNYILFAAAPQTQAKQLFFRQKLNFSGRIQQPEMEKKNLVFIIQKKRNSFHLARQSARNPWFLLKITGWGESGKAILQVSIAVFWAMSKKFSGKDGSAPWKKLPCLPMIYM